MQKRYIPSTVIVSVFVLIGILLAAFILPINVAQLTESASAGGSGLEEEGELAMIGLLVAGTAILIAILFLYAIAVYLIAAHGFLIFFSVRNHKSSVKAIRVINYVLTGLNAALILTGLIKILLWRFCGM